MNLNPCTRFLQPILIQLQLKQVDSSLFYANDDTAWSVLNTNFKLSGGGEHVGLWNPEQVFMDSITYGEQIADTSYGRYQDGTDNWYMMADFTPGASNTNPNVGPADVDALHQ